MIRKLIVSTGAIVLSATFIYSTPLVQNKYGNTVLSGQGISSRNSAHEFQSKGLNSIVKAGSAVYKVSLNSSNRIVIHKINGVNLEEYMTVGAEVVCSPYETLRGVGSVCADNSRNIYISYIYTDGSVKTAKISMDNKTIVWNPPYKPKSTSKYLPLDSVVYYGNVYVLVCEDLKNYHIVKITGDGGSVSTFASQTNSYMRFNAMAAVNNFIYIYGGDSSVAPAWSSGGFFEIYIIKYDLSGKNRGEKRHDISSGAIMRIAVHDESDVYALFRDKSSTNKYKILKMNELNVSWQKDINNLDFNSLYADSNGIYIGYSSGNKSGYQRWDPSGNLKEDKFVIASANVVQSDSVYVSTPDAAVLLFSSLNNSNKDALFTSIPSDTRSSYAYNPDGADYKDSLQTPKYIFDSSAVVTYKVNYVNYKNAAPDSGYPKLYIYDNGSLMSTNNMSAENSSDTDYTDGKVYIISKSLAKKSKYSYKVELKYGNDFFTSDEYFFPKQGIAPTIEYFEGNSYILPNADKNVYTSLSAKIKFNEPNGLKISGESPVFTLSDNSNNSIIKSGKMTSAGNSVYYYNINTLPVGNYNYKIEAKNELNISAVSAVGVFEVKEYSQASPPQILYFEGNSYIHPAEKKNINTVISVKAKFFEPEGLAIHAESPVFSLYDYKNELVYSGKMSSAPDTDNSLYYYYNIGVLPVGSYKYKIEAKNALNISAVPVESTFEVEEYSPQELPQILYLEGNSYIYPETEKNINTVMSAKMKFFDPFGLAIHTDSPVFSLYDYKNELIYSGKMSSASDINNPVYYYYNIGSLQAGRYSYKIEAKNELSVAAVNAVGNFEVKVFEEHILPKITYSEMDSYILPLKRKYVDTNIVVKAKVKDPNNNLIADGYPKISLYNLKDASLVISAQMSLISSDGNYQYNIGMLPAGKYKYKIEARNNQNMEAVPAEGIFEVFSMADELAGKIFNAPNPFNPARGQSTKILFKANGNETVRIRIYTLMGDKVFEDTYHAMPGTNEYEYKGRDNSGKMLYNGAYLCVLEKPSGNGRCKMLVIK
ncbi:MAG: hypothetical protein LBL00_05050 [Endomicrobium sp.]|jgi:hypothetical protein|nr:hypothetical protein [Endomicrobium sp.]